MPLRFTASIRLLALIGVCAALAIPASAEAPGEPPVYEVADPSAPPVTVETLLESERFWPYRVQVRMPWIPPGRKAPIRPDRSGVLIRVEEGGHARVDFGRDGLHRVPVKVTNVVERANEVRLGSRDKLGANLVLSLGPRIVDSASEPPRTVGLQATYDAAGFLVVFADPAAPDFPRLADALAPLRGRDGLMTVLLPVGDLPDPDVRKKLRALDWPVAFMSGYLAGPYRKVLLEEGAPLPAVALSTPEGRILYGGGLADELTREVSAAWASDVARRGGAPKTTTTARTTPSAAG